MPYFSFNKVYSTYHVAIQNSTGTRVGKFCCGIPGDWYFVPDITLFWTIEMLNEISEKISLLNKESVV